jgi:4-amino-4-deoxy-L-arabinose transferase-like glycosyltransferase
VYRLGAQSLWIDEVFTLHSSGVGSPFQAADLLGDIHGSLYSLVLHAFSRALGHSEWALRLPSVVFGVAMVPAMAMLAREWIGDRAVKPAAWLTAFSPFLVWYSQETRNYMLLMLCACLSALAMLRLRRDPARAGAAAWLGCTWAGLLSNFSFALIGPLELWWWMTARASLARRVAGAAVATAALLALMSPWIVKAVEVWDFQRLSSAAGPGAGAPLRGGTTFHPAAYPFALHAFAVGYTLGPSLRELRAGSPAAALLRHAGEIVAVTVVFGALGLAGFAALRRRGRLIEVGLWLVVPALVVSYFAARNFKVFNPRYLAVSVPAFLLLMAAGFADLGRRRAIAAALALAALWGVSLSHHYFVPAYGKEDYRGAAQLVRDRGHAGERVVALGAVEPVFYYYRGPLPAATVWLGYATHPASLESKLGGALAGARGAWLVLSRPEDLDPGEAFAGWMSRRYPGVEPIRLEGVRVWHLGPEDVGRLEAAAGH